LRNHSGMSMEPKTIKSCGAVKARLRLPGSKSISARALICAALGDGRSELPGFLICDDTRYLAQALTQLGIVVSFGPTGDSCTVEGLGGDVPVRSGELFLGNAGTAMRFLTGVLTVAEGTYDLDGDARMRKRPIGPLVRALCRLGAKVTCEDGYPPVHIEPRRLRGGRVEIEGSLSSQYVTALLLAAPGSRKGVEVRVLEPVVSRPYLDLTVQVMETFGCRVVCFEDPLRFRVAPGRYKAQRFPIEPDASSAGYFFAAAAVTGGEVTVEGLGTQSRQGDTAMVDILASMGCSVEKKPESFTVRGGPLRGISLDARNVPDLVPTVAFVSALAEGKTEIRGVPHLRIKESDRIRSVASELRKLGARVEEKDDGLVVYGGKKLSGAVIDPWGDHRIAMAASVLGLTVPGVVISQPEVVTKSFPDFFKLLEQLAESAQPPSGR